MKTFNFKQKKLSRSVDQVFFSNNYIIREKNKSESSQLEIVRNEKARERLKNSIFGRVEKERVQTHAHIH